MDKKMFFPLCVISLMVLSLLSASVMAGIPGEAYDYADGVHTDSWAYAWLYAEYHPQPKIYSNIKHDYNWYLESGYSYKVFPIPDNDPEYPATTTQILVFIDYWRQDALARVQFYPW